MHTEAFDFVRRVVQSLPPLVRVAEFGSRVVNGSVREIFTDARHYVGVDPVPGPGVDSVMDAAIFFSPPDYDAVVCCETLEHVPHPDGLCRAAFNVLRPGGVFIVTCASPMRKPHGADGGILKDGEHYAGISAALLSDLLRTVGFASALMELRRPAEDTYALALKAR